MSRKSRSRFKQVSSKCKKISNNIKGSEMEKEKEKIRRAWPSEKIRGRGQGIRSAERRVKEENEGGRRGSKNGYEEVRKREELS